MKRVAKSPLSAETQALGELADAAKLLGNLLFEIHKLDIMPSIKCLTDSKSLYEAVHTCNSLEDKSLCIEIARIREMKDLKELSIQWVKKKEQLADVMTKRGASPERLLEVLKLCTI